jgi:RHS repeat-associated protein
MCAPGIGYTLWGGRTRLSGDLDADFGFTGHYHHAPSGLSLAPYRAYSSEMGRWLSRDPIGEEGGINLYGYVNNNPVGAIDPEGASSTLVTGAIGAGIGALVGGGITAWNGGSWSEIGMSAGRGAIAGGVAGLTMGIGGGAVAGIFGGGVLGGAASGAVAGAAGNVGAQGFDFATGLRCEFGWGELGMSAGTGALFGGAFARPWTAPNQQITSWTSNGVAPNLNTGRWVMTGGSSLGNYARTVGPALRGYPYGNSATSTVPGSTLFYPPGATGNMAGILGQRVINP